MQSEHISAIQDMLELSIFLGAIILLPILLVGLVVAIFQAATQINEQTLSFLPKLAISALVTIWLGDLMTTSLVEYTVELFRSIPSIIK